MADAGTENLVNGVKTLSVSDTGDQKENANGENDYESWGFPLAVLYKLALKFYKGNLMLIM